VKFNDLKKQNQIFSKKFINTFQKKIKDSDFIGGKSVKDFEKNFASFTNSKYSLGVGNGTDAIYIALKALDITFGDEIITTNHSWISTIETIVACGATPVIVDTKNNYLIDEDQIEKFITKKTKAIMVVHLYGNACRMDKISKIANKYKLHLIEDCAQAHGCRFNGIHVGNFGHFGTFSFFPAKNLGCLGDGGAIISNKKKLITKARKIANHGGLKKNSHVNFGMNSRLDSLQADFLNFKLKKLNDFNKKRINIANIYLREFDGFKEIKLPRLEKNINHVFHQFVIKVKNRTKLINYLLKNKIPTGIHYPKLFSNITYYKTHMRFKTKELKNSNSYENQILSLPIHPYLSKKDVLKVCNKIKDFYKK
jgi:dTDP-4-amino-4,6-dideoxygalactose transaminase